MKQAWVLRELPDEPPRALSSVWWRPTIYVSGYGDDGVAVFALSKAKVFRSVVCAERYRRRLSMPDRWTAVPLADAMLDYEARTP